MKLFFIFSQHRTGSRMLCSLLDSHPDISCPHESLDNGLVSDLDRFGLMDYTKLAGKLKKEHPTAKFIGLHGHYEWLSEQVHLLDVPKILLYRQDEILGGVKQSIMRIKRPNKQFDLDPGTALWNAELRIKRHKEMSVYSTMKISYEKMTNCGQSIDRMDKKLNKKVLRHIGAKYFSLTTKLEKEPEYLPRNLSKIYELANNYAAES